MDVDQERRKGKAGGGEQEEQVLPKRDEKNPMFLIECGDSHAPFRTWTFSCSLQDLETFSCFTEYVASHAPSFRNALCKQHKSLKEKFCTEIPIVS